MAKRQTEIPGTAKERKTPERRTARDILSACGNDLMNASKRANPEASARILSLALQCKELAAIS